MRYDDEAIELTSSLAPQNAIEDWVCEALRPSGVILSGVTKLQRRNCWQRVFLVKYRDWYLTNAIKGRRPPMAKFKIGWWIGKGGGRVLACWSGLGSLLSLCWAGRRGRQGKAVDLTAVIVRCFGVRSGRDARRRGSLGE